MSKILLLQKLDDMKIEPEGSALTFPARLARENGWTLGFADQVYGEYKRFLYLAATSDHPVTPSDEVDQAWHLHLTYTRHYWGVLCAEILEKPLHHGPTEGGAAEDQRYRAQYEATLFSYAEIFGAEAPADIWPPADIRFGTAYRRVVDGQHWMVRKKPVYAAVPMLALAACTQGDFAFAATFTVVLGLIAAIALVVASSQSRDGKRKKDKNGGCGGSSGCGASSNSDSSGCGSGCGGGCGS